MSPVPIARQAPVTLRDVAHGPGSMRPPCPACRTATPASASRTGRGPASSTSRRRPAHRPNRVARSLKLRRTRIIGMLIPDVTNPLFSALFRAVDDAAGDAGYHVILCNTDDRARRLEEHLDALGEGHVDGLLIATARLSDPVVGTLRHRGLPYVLVNRRRDDLADAWVVPDDRAGGAPRGGTPAGSGPPQDRAPRGLRGGQPERVAAARLSGGHGRGRLHGGGLAAGQRRARRDGRRAGAGPAAGAAARGAADRRVRGQRPRRARGHGGGAAGWPARARRSVCRRRRRRARGALHDPRPDDDSRPDPGDGTAGDRSAACGRCKERDRRTSPRRSGYCPSRWSCADSTAPPPPAESAGGARQE